MEFIKKLAELGYEKQANLLWGKMQEKELNSIWMGTKKAEESQFVIGESKIGGLPHLPRDFDWPEHDEKPLAFLAQLNLEEVTKYDEQQLLPSRGFLSFFHEGGESVWGFDPKDKGGFCVIYHTGSADDLVATELPVELEDYLRFSPCKLTFSQKKSYPSWEDYFASDFPFIHRNKDSYCKEVQDAFFDMSDEGVVNKLFGYPNLVQGDIFLESQLVTNGLYCGNATGYDDPRRKELEQNTSEWMLLFQIDSDNNANMMWGDVGRIFFVIKKSDLTNLNFDAIWSVFQCY